MMWSTNDSSRRIMSCVWWIGGGEGWSGRCGEQRQFLTQNMITQYPCTHTATVHVYASDPHLCILTHTVPHALYHAHIPTTLYMHTYVCTGPLHHPPVPPCTCLSPYPPTYHPTLLSPCPCPPTAPTYPPPIPLVSLSPFPPITPTCSTHLFSTLVM